jgi:hypothetical protein
MSPVAGEKYVAPTPIPVQWLIDLLFGKGTAYANLTKLQKGEYMKWKPLIGRLSATDGENEYFRLKNEEKAKAESAESNESKGTSESAPTEELALALPPPPPPPPLQQEGTALSPEEKKFILRNITNIIFEEVDDKLREAHGHVAKIYGEKKGPLDLVLAGLLRATGGNRDATLEAFQSVLYTVCSIPGDSNVTQTDVTSPARAPNEENQARIAFLGALDVAFNARANQSRHVAVPEVHHDESPEEREARIRQEAEEVFDTRETNGANQKVPFTVEECRALRNAEVEKDAILRCVTKVAKNALFSRAGLPAPTSVGPDQGPGQTHASSDPEEPAALSATLKKPAAAIVSAKKEEPEETFEAKAEKLLNAMKVERPGKVPEFLTLQRCVFLLGKGVDERAIKNCVLESQVKNLILGQGADPDTLQSLPKPEEKV